MSRLHAMSTFQSMQTERHAAYLLPQSYVLRHDSVMYASFCAEGILDSFNKGAALAAEQAMQPSILPVAKQAAGISMSLSSCRHFHGALEKNCTHFGATLDLHGKSKHRLAEYIDTDMRPVVASRCLDFLRPACRHSYLWLLAAADALREPQCVSCGLYMSCIMDVTIKCWQASG